jgi:hypothetical protein
MPRIIGPIVGSRRTILRRERHTHNVNYIDEESASDDEAEICVAQWVDTPRDKLISCSFLKPNTSKKDEMRFTFDEYKCNKLFDLLVRVGMIKLAECHTIPTAKSVAKRKYCKWHDPYSHTTN